MDQQLRTPGDLLGRPDHLRPRHRDSASQSAAQQDLQFKNHFYRGLTLAILHFLRTEKGELDSEEFSF